MSRKNKQIPRQHQKAKLVEVLGESLITWREKYCMGQMNGNGLYNLDNEEVFVKNLEDKASMSVAEFERYLNDKISPEYRKWQIVYNPTITGKENTRGHMIYFYIDEWKGVIPVTAVGKSGDITIPAMVQGGKVWHKGQAYKNSGVLDETPYVFRGWVAAYEICKAAYEVWMREGVDQRTVITPEEIRAIQSSYTMIGFKDKVQNFIPPMDLDKIIASSNDTPIDSPKLLEDKVEKVIPTIIEEKLNVLE